MPIFCPVANPEPEDVKDTAATVAVGKGVVVLPAVAPVARLPPETDDSRVIFLLPAEVEDAATDREEVEVEVEVRECSDA